VEGGDHGNRSIPFDAILADGLGGAVSYGEKGDVWLFRCKLPVTCLCRDEGFRLHLEPSWFLMATRASLVVAAPESVGAVCVALSSNKHRPPHHSAAGGDEFPEEGGGRHPGEDDERPGGLFLARAPQRPREREHRRGSRRADEHRDGPEEVRDSKVGVGRRGDGGRTPIDS